MSINVMKMAHDRAAMAKAAEEIAAQLVQNVPDEMKAVNNWVNFKLVPNSETHSGFDKVPINPKDGENAQSNNPDTWGTFNQALERLKHQPGKVHGVGLMLGHSQFAGFDDDEIYAKLLDDQLKEDISAGKLPEDTDLKEMREKVKANGGYNGLTIAEMSVKALESGNFYGADLVKEFNSYTEVSPSGNGLHVYFVGKLPPKGRRKEYFEMYEDGRYLTVTGEPYKGFKAMSEPTAEVIAKYHKKYIINGIYGNKKKKTSTAPPPPKPTMSSRPAVLDDNQIITKAQRNPKFAALWAGNISGYTSKSEADAALCAILAYWTGGNADQMDRLFRQSGLYRDKWDERHHSSGETYGQGTIQSAIEFCPNFYDPNYYSNSSGFYVNIKSPGSTPISIDGTTAPAEFAAYNWDGTPKAPAGAAADQSAEPSEDQSAAPSEDQPQPITLEQIKAYTPEQWNELAKQHFNEIPLNNDRVIEKFKQLFIKCLKARLLQNKRLPEYIQPVVKSRRENGAEFVSITGFEINHVPLARSLYNDLHIVNITSKDNAAGMLYVYKHGKYERIDPEEERGIVRKRVEYIDKYGKMWNAKTIKDTSLLLHSPLEVHELEDFNTNEKIINFQNGLLDLESGTLYPHTHNVLSTVQLPLIYDPNAGTDTPLFDSMIDHFADGDEEVKTLLLQFCAATISNIDMGTVKCFLMLYGAGDSGKSQLFQLLHKLVGKKNTHTTTLSDLTANRFEPINLYGMRFAGDPELEYTVSITHAAKIKQYTGGDNIRGEVKCGGTFQFKYKGTLLFCSNERPRILSADTAFYNRLRMIYVKKPVENIDRRFLEKMWEERQRIINKLMPYVCEIIKYKTIIDPVSSKELKKQYKVFNNPAIEFFTECCKMRTAEEINPAYRKKISDNRTAANVYDKFVEWYDANGYPRQGRPDRPTFAKSIGHYLRSENITDMDDVRIKKNGGIQYYVFRDLTDAEIAAQQQDEIENAAPSAPADSQLDDGPPPIWETELF